MASFNSLTKILIAFSLLFITFPTPLSTTSLPPSPPPETSSGQDLLFTKPPFATISAILSSLGYHDLALASHTLSLSTTTTTPPWLGPITLFAPSDASLRTCQTCSLSLLLQEHSVPGLYTADYLRRLTFGTKIETLLPGRCLTLTSTKTTANASTTELTSRIFVGGVEITFPDLFSNGHVIIHGIQGYLSHLSPYSCSIDKMTSLSLPHPSPTTALTRMMLADAMIRLRTSGYSILALAMRVKYAELASLHNMTIFAIDDVAIFHGGHSYIHSVRFHILPNRMLRYSDLESLPVSTVLPTLEIGESLTVTSSGGGGITSPMRINYVRVKYPDLLYNMKLVVHGLSSPFPRLMTPSRHSFTSADSAQSEMSQSEVSQSAPSPVIKNVAADTYLDYSHHGL